MAFLDEFFEVFMPRQVCMRHEPDVVWLHVVSDTLIALAYFSIPLALVHFVRRRDDLAFNWMFLLFAGFIMACGLTHVFGVIDMWAPVYRLDGVVKLGTGIISAATAILLWQLIPTALALPSPAQLRIANEALAREVTERRGAQEALARLSAGLEERVEARTRELDQLNQDRQQLLVAEKRARTEAEQANRLKDDFVATLSHELRTPMTAILGWVTLLRKGGQAELHRGLEVIERNVRMQQRLIDDLLDTNRIVAGKMQLDMQEVDLRQVLAAAVDTLEPAADARQIQVQVDLGAPCIVRGDAHRLQQVVWNLLSNAIKFTPTGGTVSLVLTREATEAVLVVRDDGDGIDPEFLPHVFERFRQADPSTSRRVGGLGLGLAIVKQLVELHGGRVGVTSAGPGRGAEFLVRLPLIDSGKAGILTGSMVNARGEPAAATDIRLDGATLLVVDDEGDVRDLVARVLSGAGATVRLAASATEALGILDTQAPDLLLSDIGMPGMDGVELIRQLRAREAAAGGRIPAIALTAFGRDEDRATSLEAGYQLHLVKPVEVNQLLAAVASLVNRSGRHSSC